MTEICKRIVIPNVNADIDVDINIIVDILENKFALGEIGKLELFKISDKNGNPAYLCNVFFNCLNDDSYIYSCDVAEAESFDGFDDSSSNISIATLDEAPQNGFDVKLHQYKTRNIHLPNSSFWTLYETDGLFDLNIIKEVWERDDSEILWR
jgi:hypothetical protein